jgi:hypothetical protein
VHLDCNAFGYPSNLVSLEVLKFQQLLLRNSHVDITASHNKDKAKLTSLNELTNDKLAIDAFAWITKAL